MTTKPSKRFRREAWRETLTATAGLAMLCGIATGMLTVLLAAFGVDVLAWASDHPLAMLVWAVTATGIALIYGRGEVRDRWDRLPNSEQERWSDD